MSIEEAELAEILGQEGYSIREDPMPLKGTITGATWSKLPSFIKPVLRFDGVDDYVSISNKYKAVRTEYAGRNYPSKHHAEVAQDLDTAVKGGVYDAIIEEIPFRLPGKTNTGRPFIHRVDFGCLKDGKVIRWIEAKGKDLELGKLKRRQTEEIYKIKVDVL